MEPVAHPTPYSMSLRRACWDVPAGASVPSRGGWEGGVPRCVLQVPNNRAHGARVETFHSALPGSREQGGDPELCSLGFLERKACLEGECFSEDV